MGNKVDKSRLRPVDATDWAERPKLFADTFGGWNVVEYMQWLGRMKEKYHSERGTVAHNFNGYKEKPEWIAISNQDDFTEYLKRKCADVNS